MSEVRSAARVLELLEYFAGIDGSASLATVVSTFGLPKSSAFGLLKTLCARGYLVRNEQGSYELNPYFRSHGFGWGGDHIARLSALAEPVMKLLAEELDESVSLGIMTKDGEVKVIKQTLCKQPIRYEITVNQLLPAFCTAMGRVMLSVLPDETKQRMLTQQKIVARTPVTITDPTRIEQIIQQAGIDGYCVVADESDLGGTGVATCISFGPGRPTVAMNVACISARFPEKREAVIAALMRESAKLRERDER
ncbi:IclR family transcriptional regulator [Caballeronia arvi]|uniref:IclR family transcriptional regulator n=1 Tax=Caballeronia arvi TaxID=1777135 RepID=A0A158KVT2_9BURK|nr:IclR family transcriptional regulator [Caballeronia arvi]SAL85278.1 IclR family transcriptional regulator [Caballeronia arvi]